MKNAIELPNHLFAVNSDYRTHANLPVLLEGDGQKVTDYLQALDPNIIAFGQYAHTVRGTIARLIDFGLRRNRDIDETAKIHPTARLGKNVRIGSRTIVQDHTEIGDDVTIGSDCLVGSRSKIGDGATLQEYVIIDADVEIGKHCTLGDDYLGNDHKLKIVRSGTRIDHATVWGKTYIGHDCRIKDAYIGRADMVTVLGDRVFMAYDTQARGFIPSDSEILNCGAMVGKFNGSTIKTDDWWLNAGIITPEEAAREKGVSLEEFMRSLDDRR